VSEGPGAGRILAGIFLILCGLCLTLLGGGCTAMWLFFLFNEGGVETSFFLLSLAALAIGLLLLWAAFRLLRSNPAARSLDAAEPPNQP
jgi:hypothetical protein